MGNSGDIAKLVEDRNARLAGTPNAAGCVGHDIGTCLWMLSRTMVIAGSQREPITIKQPKVDIYGKGQDELIVLPGWFPGEPPEPYAIHSAGTPAMFFVIMGPDFVVKGVSGDLHGSFLSASTKEDFDRTHVYEVAQAMLGATCVGPDRLSFYRTLKSSLKDDGHSTEVKDDGIHRFLMETTQMCGYTVHVEASFVEGVEGTTGGVSLVVAPLKP